MTEQSVVVVVEVIRLNSLSLSLMGSRLLKITREEIDNRESGPPPFISIMSLLIKAVRVSAVASGHPSTTFTSYS